MSFGPCARIDGRGQCIRCRETAAWQVGPLASSVGLNIAPHCVTQGAGIMQRVVPASKLLEVRFKARLVCLIPNERGVPALWYAVQDVNEQIPVPMEIHAERPSPKLLKPLVKRSVEACSRKHPLRILAKLRDDRLANKCAAGLVVKVGPLRIEFAPVVRDQRDADQVAVDEIGEFGVDKYSHRHVRVVGWTPTHTSISRPGLKSGFRCRGEYPRGLQTTRVPRALDLSPSGTM